jgi:hypothetical protein
MRRLNDLNGRPVRLKGERSEHIENEHPEMNGQLEHIQATLLAPDKGRQIQDGHARRAFLSSL